MSRAIVPDPVAPVAEDLTDGEVHRFVNPAGAVGDGAVD